MVNIYELLEQRKRQAEESQAIEKKYQAWLAAKLSSDGTPTSPEASIMGSIIRGEKANGLTGEFLLHGLLGTSGITDRYGTPDRVKMLDGLYQCYNRTRDGDIPLIFENALLRYCDSIGNAYVAEEIITLLTMQLRNQGIGAAPYRINTEKILEQFKKRCIEHQEMYPSESFERWCQQLQRYGCHIDFKE